MSVLDPQEDDNKLVNDYHDALDGSGAESHAATAVFRRFDAPVRSIVIIKTPKDVDEDAFIEDAHASAMEKFLRACKGRGATREPVPVKRKADDRLASKGPMGVPMYFAKQIARNAVIDLIRKKRHKNRDDHYSLDEPTSRRTRRLEKEGAAASSVRAFSSDDMLAAGDDQDLWVKRADALSHELKDMMADVMKKLEAMAMLPAVRGDLVWLRRATATKTWIEGGEVELLGYANAYRDLRHGIAWLAQRSSVSPEHMKERFESARRVAANLAATEFNTLDDLIAHMRGKSEQ